MHSTTKKHNNLFLLIAVSALFVFVFVSMPAFYLANDAYASNEEALREELRRFEEELERHRQIKDERERQLAILQTEIESIEAQIRHSQIIVEETEAAVQNIQAQIETLSAEIEQNKALLSDLLLSIYKMDETSSVEILFQTETLSEFYGNVRNIQLIQDSATKTLVSIQEIRGELEQQEAGLNERMEEQGRLLHLNGIQQQQLEARRAQQEHLLASSSAQVNRAERSAQQIRNQLFRLTGGGGVSMSFQDALRHARAAESVTGVRPAFLLAILKIESSWGANVGTCYLVSPNTGDLRHVNTGRVWSNGMPSGSPRDDVTPFMQITRDVGKTWQTTPVSCPAPYGGYGGAMGPAQFIPTTWMSIVGDFRSRMGYTPDPWNVRDAFVASAILLARYGAAHDEMNAARSYVGRGAPDSAYALPVMRLADEIQRDIDILEGN